MERYEVNYESAKFRLASSRIRSDLGLIIQECATLCSKTVSCGRRRGSPPCGVQNVPSQPLTAQSPFVQTSQVNRSACRLIWLPASNLCTFFRSRISLLQAVLLWSPAYLHSSIWLADHIPRSRLHPTLKPLSPAGNSR